MANILLFGSYNIQGVPSNVTAWLEEYARQGHTFIVGDGRGLDSAYHKTLSSIGATNVKIYAMDNARHNIYDFPVERFLTAYDEQSKQATIYSESTNEVLEVIDNVVKVQDIQITRQWYEFRDKKMIQDCDMAICLFDGENKTALHMIQLMNIYNKPVYTFTF